MDELGAEKLVVNDGGGLFNFDGMTDGLLVDCNDLAGALFSGHYVLVCRKIVEMVQKIAAIKQGVNDSRKLLEKQLAESQAFCQKLADQLNNTEGADADGMER